jgi:recombinational DNA repair ATPase RecF
VRVEAKRRWDAIKSRYREAREKAFWRAELRKDIQESAEWRKYLRTLDNESSSESEADQPVRIKRAARKVGGSQQGETGQGEMNQADYLNRIKSMLTSSSASSFDSDEPSKRRRYLNNSQCRMEHQHCPVLPAADQESSG